MTQNYDLIRKAVVEGKQVIFNYQGYSREVCPHAIGFKNGLEKVLTFQFAGGSSSGLPIDGQWRCLFISDISDVQIRDGKWYSRDSHKRPQTCIDQLDVEVRVSDAGLPIPYFKSAYS
jgi:hypothetical protein